jgi:hypothetical protein
MFLLAACVCERDDVGGVPLRDKRMQQCGGSSDATEATQNPQKSNCSPDELSKAAIALVHAGANAR